MFEPNDTKYQSSCIKSNCILGFVVRPIMEFLKVFLRSSNNELVTVLKRPQFGAYNLLALLKLS